MTRPFNKFAIIISTILMLSGSLGGVANASNISSNNQQSNKTNVVMKNTVPHHHHFSGSKFNEWDLTPQQKQESSKIQDIITQFAEQRYNEYYPHIARNARSLAGYTTANGKYKIRADRLIRSNNLDTLDKSGKHQLHRLHVNKIIDLRDTPQIDKLPDPNESIPHFKGYYYTDKDNPDIRVINFPVYTAHEQNINKVNVHKYGEIYAYETMLVRNPKARKSYGRALKVILHHKHGAVLYHCIEGRDRTGILSVLILSTLGIKKQDIYKDYLLTNYYNHKHPYIRQYEQLNAFFKTVHDHYGNIHNYLHKLGMNNKDIRAMQKEYLVRNK